MDRQQVLLLSQIDQLLFLLLLQFQLQWVPDRVVFFEVAIPLLIRLLLAALAAFLLLGHSLQVLLHVFDPVGLVPLDDVLYLLLFVHEDAQEGQLLRALTPILVQRLLPLLLQEAVLPLQSG